MRQKRHLELEGAYNIRDLGGYPTVDGQTTRWGTVLRGDNMHRLPSESQAALIDYGVRTVIDLRKDYELEQMPNVFAGSSAVDYHHQDMLGDTGTIESAERPSSDEMWSSIAINYVHFLEERRPQVGETLATLAATGALPGIFHCAAGKDRTGLIAALLLGIAGVPANTIAEDYTLSARYLFEPYVREVAPPGLPSSYSMEDYRRENCPPEAMLGTLRHLDERYGGVEAYVRATGLSESEMHRLQAALVE